MNQLQRLLDKFKNLPKKDKTRLAVLFFIVVVIPLAVILSGQIQELRKRAEGTREVDLRFDPSEGERQRGETFRVDIKLYNTTSDPYRDILISGAQAVIEVDERFDIETVACQPPFTGLKIERIEGNKTTLMCAISIGNDPQTVPATGLVFASFNLTVKEDAQEGEAKLEFRSTRATEAGVEGEAPDVSTSGQDASFTIVFDLIPTPTSTPTSQVTLTLTPTPTQTPTFTPTPSPTAPIGGILSPTPTDVVEPTLTPTGLPLPTNTPTPTLIEPPTITSTPTLAPEASPTEIPLPTIAPNQPSHPCPGKARQGNYNCQGGVDEDDFLAWREDYIGGFTTLEYFEYWRRNFFDNH